MIFNSFQYFLFFAVVFVVYWRLDRLRWQNILLLVASYLFYATWDWRFVTLIIISTVMDYFMGLWIDKAQKPRARYALLMLSMVTNLGILGFFKYFNFFIDSASTLLGGLGLQVNEMSLQIILPVGISFYTFQTMSYTIDIYRRKFQPTHNFINFALFVAFFPQLVAGPIERAIDLLPQMERRRSITPEAAESGLILILTGLIRKVIIADVAASMIDPEVFVNPSAFSGGQILLVMYLFALQIYGDFAGYSDMARGSARLLGFDLKRNFNQPYFSQTVSEFWRRWHISLSGWFRDYVYIPLNDRLKGRMRWGLLVYTLSVLITMLLSGLWHGAAWTFVLWGGLLGLYQVIARPLRGTGARWLQHPNPWVRRATVVFRVVLTFHLVLLAWVLFRALDISSAVGVYDGIGRAVTGDWSQDALRMIAPVVLLYIASYAIDIGQYVTDDHAFVRRFSTPLRIAVYVVSLCSMVFFTIKPYVPFIYFQF